MCPGNKQSGGKRLSGATTAGNPSVRAILGEMAWAVAHTKDNYLSAFYHRRVRRRGKHKAIMALCHKLLIIIYHVLQQKQSYEDLGGDYFDQLDAAQIQRHHVKCLQQLGFDVSLTPINSAKIATSS